MRKFYSDDPRFSFESYFEQKFAHVERGRSDMHAYQSDIAVPFLIKNPFSALFVDLGLGKSVVTLTVIADLISELISQGCDDHILVIGPSRVVNQTWPEEIGLWEHTAPLTWTLIRDEIFQESVRLAGRIARAPIVAAAREEAVARGFDPDLDPIATRAVINEYLKRDWQKIEKARRLEARVQVRKATLRNPATIHLINREQVEALVAAWGKDWPYSIVIIDESSDVKDHKTGRFKALRRVRPMIKRLHELTATPAAESYMGLFAQMYLLDEGKRLGKDITYYRERYFSRGYDGYSYKLRPGADEEIAAKISDICLTLKRKDYLKDLKDPIYNPVYVELAPDQMAMYRELAKEFVLELDDGTEVEAETAAALSSKLLQLASGSIYDDEKQTHFVHDHKIEALRGIVEEAQGQPLLVAYWFKSSLARLKEAFPKAVVMDPTGKVVPKWNKGKIKMLLVHPQGSGHGLNLQHGGHHLVFFDIPWSLELYQQIIGRLDRQGQLEAVVLHHIIARGTIDEYVIKCLRVKADMQEKLFRFIQSMRRRMRRLEAA